MLDETHLGAWLHAKFSTKPNWDDNPTSRRYVDGIHNSSLLKNVSDSHELMNPRSCLGMILPESSTRPCASGNPHADNEAS